MHFVVRVSVRYAFFCFARFASSFIGQSSLGTIIGA
jgi:hypothetical protein